MSVSIYRGDTWERVWQLKDAAGAAIDLTGATARLQVRHPETDAVVVSASSADGKLVITAVEGKIAMVMPYADMALAGNAYPFDLEITYPSGRRKTYERNVLVVIEDITRD